MNIALDHWDGTLKKSNIYRKIYEICDDPLIAHIEEYLSEEILNQTWTNIFRPLEEIMWLIQIGGKKE